jgi:uncharacterized hydrophobic protein (TIGR00271 family)
MADYVASALFVHTEDTAYIADLLKKHPCGAVITPITFERVMSDPHGMLKGVAHIVTSGPLEAVKGMLELAAATGVSIGLVPTESQKNLRRLYKLPRSVEEAVDLALQTEPKAMDLLLCNGRVVLFRATVGRIPLLDAPVDLGNLSILKAAASAFFNIRLLKFDFTTAGERQITTAASGCIILQNYESSIASRLISGEGFASDGSVSTVISAPISVIDYLKFLLNLLSLSKDRKRLPSAIGYIKSPTVKIEPESELDVFIDGEPATRTPIYCEAKPGAVRVNVGQSLREEGRPAEPAKERIQTDHLPKGKELLKTRKKRTIPFFSYASEDRFRDLFTALRDDAEINNLYLVLMLLSTMLAATGLYLNSASVIIGAMLLAPLMAPIVSLAMGILRGYDKMIKKSLGKIAVGVTIALLASIIITLLFPDKPITGEMQARLNPTLLDLAVAIISGIAAAYSKSFREIIQSLAGVAIAVALVPPLAVAGTGIGRWDFQFFFQAFLLFSTNLVGIVIAATLTFRMLGYSPAIRSKRNLGMVLCLLLLIAVPLYLSYHRIIEERVFEKGWQNERFLINGKYIIVESADLRRLGDKKIVVMEIVVHDQLGREDMEEFKRKIQAYFPDKLIIRAKTTFIP